MRKTRLALTSAALLLLAASGATQAADSATLSVIGSIAPVGCTPSFSDGGVVDYGNILSDSLNATSTTALPRKEISFSVTCSAATKVGYTVMDNRAGTASSGYSYNAGLGLDGGGNKIGNYVVVPAKATSSVADGNNVDVIRSNDNGATFALMNPDTGLDVNGSQWITWAVPSTTTPATFTTVSNNLIILGSIARSDSLDLSNDINLDGNATFTLVYL